MNSNRPLVYNPNVDLTSNSNMNTMTNDMNYYNQSIPQNYQMQQMSQAPQLLNNMEMYNNMNSNLNKSNMNYLNYLQQPMIDKKMLTKNKLKNIENWGKNEGSFKKYIQSIVIITILYIVLSNKNITILLTSNIPFLSITNSLGFNAIKGIILGLILVIFHGIIF